MVSEARLLVLPSELQIVRASELGAQVQASRRRIRTVQPVRGRRAQLIFFTAPHSVWHVAVIDIGRRRGGKATRTVACVRRARPLAGHVVLVIVVLFFWILHGDHRKDILGATTTTVAAASTATQG